jgi:hypothetical protein
VFPVRYELNSYILFRRNSVFKGINATGLCSFNYYHELVCFVYNFHKTEEPLLSNINLNRITPTECATSPEQAKIRMEHPVRQWMGRG